MKNLLTNNLTLILGIFIFILLYIGKCSSDKENENLKAQLNKEVLRNDSLVKISDGQYRKYVADTLTLSQLKKEIKNLGVKVDNPKTITKIVYMPKEVEKQIDGVVVKDSMIFIEDYYPQKENHFLKYTSKINIKTVKGDSKFQFQPKKLNLVVSQTNDGLWQTNIIGDEWLEIASLDVKSLPQETTKIKNWFKFAGLKYNSSLDKTNQNLEVLGGFRYKKIGVIGSVNTNSQVGLGLTLDF